jgi:hypothetical protein
MFLQLVHDGVNDEANARALFQYHPVQLMALVETYWRNRNWPAGAPFDPLPIATTSRIFADFPGMLVQPGLAGPTNWDHLIYAYLVENTRIFDIFAKVLQTYQFGEDLESPSVEGQRFWRNTEFLLYSDPLAGSVWNMTSRSRSDEIANRMAVYWWALGMDLTHAREIAQKHPYVKPAAGNRDFAPTFEALGREVWRGIVNAQNFSGANPSDAEAVAASAQRIYDMFMTRRQNGNLSREEFRAVSIMSWMHLAVSFNSPIVVDLKAQASSPEERLSKIAQRVGMRSHTNAKAFFDLAKPFSILLQAIEQGTYNDAGGAAALFTGPTVSLNARVVIDQYILATGRDLKAGTLLLTQQAAPPPPQPPSRGLTPVRAQLSRV